VNIEAKDYTVPGLIDAIVRNAQAEVTHVPSIKKEAQ
jgi:hypothetical protein